MIKQKGFQDYLDENPELKQKITYQEFMNGAMAPVDSDISVEEAYNRWRETLLKLEET